MIITWNIFRIIFFYWQEAETEGYRWLPDEKGVSTSTDAVRTNIQVHTMNTEIVVVADIHTPYIFMMSAPVPGAGGALRIGRSVKEWGRGRRALENGRRNGNIYLQNCLYVFGKLNI